MVKPDYTVQLSRVFQGPLDLLLHLVREQEVDIVEIEISKILDGYHAYIENLERLDVEYAGDFLVMAATLMAIKSRSLLPAEEVDLDEEIRRLKSLAGHPELYPEFVRLNAVPSILGLFTHDNPDIAADAVELLHELTDADAVESHEEGGLALVESVSANSGFEVTVALAFCAIEHSSCKLPKLSMKPIA